MTARQTETPAPEFSLVVRPSEIGPEGVTYALEASAEERAALARRFGLVAIEAFCVALRLEWLRGHRFLRMWGRFEAAVVQSCVVTLEPVHNRVDEPVEILFTVDPAAAAGGGHEVTVELDDVEPLEGDRLDIGEVVAEELLLALDPYPRAPGASLDGLGPIVSGGESKTPEPAEPVGNRPFEVLARLKRNK
jgi:uncharacterized metal-binding protein YceD (DUF177 family)